MAGYTRQSIASIINGEDITAPPLTAEFNQLQDAFNGSTGHSHDGSTGNAPKIDLTTSVSGYLPAIHGGIGGKNNFAATTNPTSTDDSTQGYAPGSMWENTTTGRVFICVGNTSSAAVWRELVQVISGNQITPETTNSVDLGTPSVRFQDLYLSGGIAAAGNVTVGGTTTVTGATTLNNTLTVAGTTLLNGNITLGDADTDNITVTGEFVSGLTPNTTGTYDLGTSTKEWRDLYIDGTAHVDTLDVDENAGIVGNLSVTGNSTLTGTLGVTGTTTVVDLAATGTTTITSGDINSGAMDGTTIGASTPAAGTFTTLTANTSLTAATADINGGTIDNATIGATTPSSAAFTTASTSGLATLASVDINGGAIDGTTIGATSHTSGKFSTLQSTGNATLATVDINGGTIDGTAIGSSSASSGAFTTLSASGGITGDLTGDVTGNLTGNVTGNITGNITGNVTGNVTASSGTSTFTNVTINGNLDMNAGTTATITNLTTPTNANDAATKGYVDTSVANLVDSAPGTLDTLNELAAALNDDPNFSTTITNSIATKLPLAGGTMTGAIAMGTSKITGMGDPTAAQDAATKNYVDNQDALQVSKSGDSMSGNLAMGSNNITGLATPTANDHATNKSYVDGILGSATAAAASAAAAATSASNAATSETNAANSASSAASDLSSVQSLYDQFDDRYLGSKSSAPTLDNDGNALLTGALYFNTTTNLMYVYSSSGWVTAGSAVNGTTDRVTYTASAGQTVFAATYDAGYVDVYMNGVKLLAGTDFTATNGTNITLASGAAVNDVIDIVGYGTFTLADHYTKTEADNRFVNVTGDTLTGTLTFAAGQTFDGRDVSADGTKLDGIEANADVTDTANVTAAGALMDSELTNITAVKALDQGVATTDKPTFNGINSTEALPTVRPSLLLDFANSKTLDPRITFTRGSTATYWDGHTTTKAEENFFKYSQGVTTNWTNFNNNFTVTTGITAPDGTSTAIQLNNTSGATAYYYQNLGFNLSSGTQYTLSFYVKSNTGSSETINLMMPSTAYSTTGTATTSWTRVSWTSTLSTSNSFAGVFVASGVNISVWGFQIEQRSSATAYSPTTSSPIVKYQPVLQTAASGEARFDHDPVTGESKGLLVEESRTNLVANSQDINTWNVYFNGNKRSNQVVAPDGTLTGDEVENWTGSAGSGLGVLRIGTASSLSTGTTYSLSIWLKSDTPGATVDVQLGDNTLLNDIALTDEWVRYTATGSPASDNYNFIDIEFPTGMRFFVWGAQVEQAAFPTSYIPTSGSTATRSAESAYIGIDSWYPYGSGGTVLVEGRVAEVSSDNMYLEGSLNGSGIYDISVTAAQTRSQFINRYVSTSNDMRSPSSTISAGELVRLVGAWSATETNSYLDGAATSSTANQSFSVGANRIYFGSRNGSSLFINDALKKVAFYPQRLSNATLQAMTEA